MSMKLINAVRKLGWPDSRGRIQYGNAAVLCYLSTCRMPVKSFSREQIDIGRRFVEQMLSA